MRFLRALLNSGVFMIILLAAATLYLVYSDAIKREHGIATTSEKPVTETATNVSTASASAAQETSVAAMVPVPHEAAPAVAMMPVPQGNSVPEPLAQQTAVVAQASAQTESTSETQQQQQVYPSMPPMMPVPNENMGQPQYAAAPMFPMPEQGQMPPPPMMPYQPQMDMQQMPPMMMPEQAQQQMQQMQPMQPMPAPEQMAMPSPMSSVAQSNLDKARAALYEGDLEVAKQAYQAELAVNNDPDLHGELGNVYFAQQDWQGAAREYAAAVDGLSAQGRFLQAQYVLGFLMQINPEMGQQAMNNLKTQMYPQNNH